MDHKTEYQANIKRVFQFLNNNRIAWASANLHGEMGWEKDKEYTRRILKGLVEEGRVFVLGGYRSPVYASARWEAYRDVIEVRNDRKPGSGRPGVPRKRAGRLENPKPSTHADMVTVTTPGSFLYLRAPDMELKVGADVLPRAERPMPWQRQRRAALGSNAGVCVVCGHERGWRSAGNRCFGCEKAWAAEKPGLQVPGHVFATILQG